VRKAVEMFRPARRAGQQCRYGNIGSVEETSLEDFRAQIETNLFCVISSPKAAFRCARTRLGTHYQVSSSAAASGRRGVRRTRRRVGVEGFSEVLAKEMAAAASRSTSSSRRVSHGFAAVDDDSRGTPEYEPSSRRRAV